MRSVLLLLPVLIMTWDAQASDPASVYLHRPPDPIAETFDAGAYGNGVTDATEALQRLINHVKATRNYGIVFIPEGRYLLSGTVHIPPAIRLIGYGERRPEFVLGPNTAGYQQPDAERYLFWFTSNLVTPEDPARDASPGTFYSALSNIDLRIEAGNPGAVALRTTFAQHSFISHSVIRIGAGKAGISDVGNEMENVEFHGGEYGIITGPTSPSWPMMMLDVTFRNQRRAAIRSFNSGLTMVNLHAADIPVVFEMEPGATDRLFLERGRFERISDAAFVINGDTSALTQINVIDSQARDVSLLARFRGVKAPVEGPGTNFGIEEFVHGLAQNSLTADARFDTRANLVPSAGSLPPSSRSVPALPPVSDWVSVLDYGAIGDGQADDSEAIRRAIEDNRTVYFPQGMYRVSSPVTLRSDSRLIGLHPWATQIMIAESETAFSGFGGPSPVVQSAAGGDAMLNGIGISTGAFNYRAVGLKWMAGANSYVNDVKFVGGHGTMRPPGIERPPRHRPGISSPSNPAYERGFDTAWDNQYWSLWIADGGGGVFKDIWTANTYAASGMLVSNTDTPGRIYAMSIEHHVRNEVRFHNVSGWKMYAFQFEEEYIEGIESRMIEVVDSDDLEFNSLWMYRTIRVQTPKRFGMRLWNAKDIRIRNLKNYTQKLWVTEFPVWDVNKELPLYPWELATVHITGNEPTKNPSDFSVGVLNRLVSGLDFAQGLTADSQGNVYFGETRRKRVYKWSVETGAVTLIADFPYPPFALATDTEDNLLVVARYQPQPGFLVEGEQETVKELPDDNRAYSSWGNSGWAAYPYAIDPDRPSSSFRVLPRVATSDIEVLDRMFYPASRWHYTFDDAASYYPDSAFVAPDGVTFIAETYDIGRTAQLAAAVPGAQLLASDEIGKRTVRMQVGPGGRLGAAQPFLPRGETAHAIDSDGTIYLADGQILVYDNDLNELDRIDLPERPISMVLGGAQKDILFVTTVESLYAIRVR